MEAKNRNNNSYRQPTQYIKCFIKEKYSLNTTFLICTLETTALCYFIRCLFLKILKHLKNHCHVKQHSVDLNLGLNLRNLFYHDILFADLMRCVLGATDVHESQMCCLNRLLVMEYCIDVCEYLCFYESVQLS